MMPSVSCVFWPANLSIVIDDLAADFAFCLAGAIVAQCKLHFILIISFFFLPASQPVSQLSS